MEINGKVIQLLPEQSGEGKNGTWKKQEFILETQDQYPKKVCISVWGDKIDQFNLSEGETVTASISVESREYNSRWYTDVRAWKIDKVAGGEVPPQDLINPTSETFSEDSPEDDLPF